MELDVALRWGALQLENSPTPAIDARLLLQHYWGVDHAYLLAHGGEPLPKDVDYCFQTAIARAQTGEPIPYIIGCAPFRYLELMVTPAVLIPRPETELLVDHLLRWAKGRSHLRVVDVGTGSGCIAISLATEMNDVWVEAVEISAESLTIAQHNANRYNAPITFHHGSLLEPISDVDVVVANLPYVTTAEWTRLADGVKLHEPAHALIGGTDGLDLVRALLHQATTKVRSDGAIFLEIGWQQGEAACAIAQSYFSDALVACHQDYAGQDRVISIVL